MGSNFRVFRATEPFHEYLTHVTLLSWVEFEQYRSKNEILTQILIITQKLDTTKISCYTVHNYLFLQILMSVLLVSVIMAPVEAVQPMDP